MFISSAAMRLVTMATRPPRRWTACVKRRGARHVARQIGMHPAFPLRILELAAAQIALALEQRVVERRVSSASISTIH